MKQSTAAVRRYWLGVMENEKAPAYRRDEAARQISRIDLAQQKRKPVGKLAREAPAKPLGKKAAAEVQARTAHKGTDWDGLLPAIPE